MEHTNWTVPLWTRRDGKNRCWVMQGKTSICHCFGKPKTAEARAKRIALCRNSHDGLVEACKAAKEYLEPDLVEPGRTVFWNLVKALKAAEGEQADETPKP